MVCGKLPFGSQSNDPYQIFKEVDLKDVEVPQSYDDENGKQVIMKLLSKNPSERFGEEFGKIKNHAYF